MNAEIIAIGSELLTPFRQDTNSLYLTEKLNLLGVKVTHKTIVGDRKQHLVDAVRHAIGRVDIVLTMGGLGPTEDDLTREAVAEALSIRLRRNQEIVAALYARFAARRIPITDNNAKQADMLDHAVPLANPNGTAPGQYLDTVWPPATMLTPGQASHRKLVLLLPGPPSELKPMFDGEAAPRLAATLPKRYIATRTIKAAMIGESAADARIAPIYNTYTDVETTILAHIGDIQLSLICAKPTQEAAQRRVDQLAAALEEELDEYIYSNQGETLERIVLYHLELRGATLSTAESCTGGLVAPAAYLDQRQLAIIPGGRGGVCERAEERFRRCRARAYREARRGVARGGRGPGGGDTREDRQHLRAGDHGHRGAYGRVGGEAGRAGVYRACWSCRSRGAGEELRRRP